MIERASEFGASAAVPLVGGDSTNKSAGDMLREAREAHGLHIDMVAAALKVSPQKLAALEGDNIEALPDAVFARALAASVCRALRIDPQPVLAKLPGAQRPGLADADRTISKSLKSAAPRSGSGASGLPSRALLVVVVLLLLGAAVLFWLPQSAFDRVGAVFAGLGSHSDTTTASGTPAAAAVEPTAPSAPPVLPPPADTAPVEAHAVAEPPAAAVSNDLIVFVARDESWITVTEAGGKQLIRRTVKAGETVGLTGALPLSVVIGRASAVDVRVRGKPFDLTPLARSGGVARFEVKP
ncbi:helix-turn-helix domain-containing protein [Variovorax ginsengisoli]|uniref:Helix-turn-helix domain-containing protein n=1 Tax=Variovorax ginsengisoli TaxID=363844 RepID=A0ABT8S2W8_9BURK|nr:helix-turn-helix domain-containing protein [Variovorax ginsengisoli]MDN8614107.1 helix-turn-helix domain-containing protein [Variovorax ginsengisoli]MDO1533277.1 helix-turn-helix domain-containing protein [Variovorax ginsengisoli]